MTRAVLIAICGLSVGLAGQSGPGAPDFRAAREEVA
jgi:hypothetical protein